MPANNEKPRASFVRKVHERREGELEPAEGRVERVGTMIGEELQVSRGFDG